MPTPPAPPLTPYLRAKEGRVARETTGSETEGAGAWQGLNGTATEGLESKALLQIPPPPTPQACTPDPLHVQHHLQQLSQPHRLGPLVPACLGPGMLPHPPRALHCLHQLWQPHRLAAAACRQECRLVDHIGQLSATEACREWAGRQVGRQRQRHGWVCITVALAVAVASQDEAGESWQGCRWHGSATSTGDGRRGREGMGERG